ncbi:MAG: hypothetical protein Q9218_003759 [Villophora microphyllina]
MGPSLEAIAQFSAITGLPNNVAAEWLKLFDNDVEKTTNAYLDDPDALQKNEDKGLTQDDLGSNRPLTLAEQEDADMQEAIKLSSKQESGVTAPDKYFGPVRNEYHDTKNWIMTTAKPTAKEILLNPEPKFRKRLDEAPAFIRPSPAGHRLPGVVTILHAIPAAREVLLNRESLQAKYDHHNEWWDGVPIQSARVVHSEEAHDTPSPDVIYESQRLMAFLDETERSYGSSEALSALPGLRECNGDYVIREYLDTWSGAVKCHNRSDRIAHIFQSRGLRTHSGVLQSEDITNYLDLSVHEPSFEPGQTLYETMDAIMWPDWDGSDPEHEVFLDEVADVFIVRIGRGNDKAKSLDIKVPPVWYSDRYHKSSQPRIRQMLAARAVIKKEIDELDTRKNKASVFTGKTLPGKSVEISRLLQIAQQHFEKSPEYQETQREPVSPVSQDGNPKIETYSRVAGELKVLSERVSSKLQAFEESKDKAREELRELSKLFTEPSDIPEESPQDRFTLRGVCANPSTVYVQERTRSSPDADLFDGPANDWQWWKLTYNAYVAQPVSCDPLREIEVLKAIRDEAPSAILVYASDRAMSVEQRDLPSQLKSFVQADNQAFVAEFASSPSPERRTSPKRRASDDIGFASYPRSPPRDRPPPSYNGDYTFPQPPRNTSYDDYIPISLRPDTINEDMDLDEGVEMLEREGGTGGAFGYEAQGEEYHLGDYVPEIEMDLEEASGEGRDSRGAG